jgi:hypothetical protein
MITKKPQLFYIVHSGLHCQLYGFIVHCMESANQREKFCLMTCFSQNSCDDSLMVNYTRQIKRTSCNKPAADL